MANDDLKPRGIGMSVMPITVAMVFALCELVALRAGDSHRDNPDAHAACNAVARAIDELAKAWAGRTT